MTTSRERVLRALNFQPVDRLPKDLYGMGSTGISCFAYPKLVAALGLPPRLPRVYDTGQMLALPDRDVLDALGTDVVTVMMNDCTNAFDEPEKWKPYDFNGRLPALVYHPEAFETKPDGSIVQWGSTTMVPGGHVFDAPHGGEALDMTGELKKADLDLVAQWMADGRYSPARVAEVAAYCRRVRESTGRAVMFNGFVAGFGFPDGMANFSMLCLSDPDYVHGLHERMTVHAIAQAEALVPAIAPYVDVIMLDANDQGTQNAPILPPETFRELYMPYYRRINEAIHRVAPQMKVFLHSCGAIHPHLEAIIEAGFDALNPVQWPAGGLGYKAWKDTCRGRIALWGGGVNTQETLPRGTVAEVEREVAEVAKYLGGDSGYVFCAIHNLMAEIEPEKIIAMYRAASRL